MSDDDNNLFELITGGNKGPDMGDAAKELFAMYLSFVEAGFTPDQSMQFMLTLLATNLKG